MAMAENKRDPAQARLRGSPTALGSRHSTSSPMWGWNSNLSGGQKTWLHMSMMVCLSLRASRLSTAFSMMSRPSWREVSRLYSADR